MLLLAVLFLPMMGSAQQATNTSRQSVAAPQSPERKTSQGELEKRVDLIEAKVLLAEAKALAAKRNPWTEPGAILGFLGSLGAIASFLIQRWWHRQAEREAADRAERERKQAAELAERERQQEADRAEREKLKSHVLDSLKWFEGKTQPRSIAIAVVEANWSTFKDLHPTWLAILVNQAIYLLKQSDEADSAHELANLDRIMTLIADNESELRLEQKISVREAVSANQAGSASGLKGVTGHNEWLKKLAKSPLNPGLNRTDTALTRGPAG